MYDFDAPLFYFKFVFLAEILVAEALIAYRMKRRPHFAWRAAGAFVCLLLFTFALPVFYNAIYSSALFMMIFLLTLVALRFCLDEPWGNIAYCGFFLTTNSTFPFSFTVFFASPSGWMRTTTSTAIMWGARATVCRCSCSSCRTW